MAEFRSKVDGWFVAAALLTAVAALLGLLVSLAEGSVAGALLSPAPLALVAWIWSSTRYIVADRELLVRCAFVRMAVPLDSITGLRRTATLRSGPALSLDRIEVQHLAGSVVISPHEIDRFARTIAARCPSADIRDLEAADRAADARVNRARRTAALALVPAFLGVAVLVAALSLRQGPPPRVTLDADRVTVESGATTVVLPADAIISASLEDALPDLRKQSGWNSWTELRGRFTAGDTTAFVHVSRRTPPYIVLRSADGLVIVNFADPVQTRAVYGEIVARRGVLSTGAP